MQPDPNLETVHRDKRSSRARRPKRGAARAAGPASTLATGNFKSPAVGGRPHRQRRATKRLANILMLVLFGPSFLLLAAMLYLVHTEYQWMQSQVDGKQAQLTSFQKQYEIGQHRLAALKSDKGNEEILIEHGYIPPGDRILLFPATGDEQRAAAIPKNDLAPHEPFAGAMPPSASASSVWRSAGNVLHGWWQELRAGAGVRPVPTASPDTKSSGAATTTETSGAEETQNKPGAIGNRLTPAGRDVTTNSPADTSESASLHAQPTDSDDANSAATASPSPATGSADSPDGDNPGAAAPAQRERGGRANSHSGQHSLSVESATAD